MHFSLTHLFSLLIGGLTTLCIADASSGCGKPLPHGIHVGGASTAVTSFMTSDGVNRSYLIHIPTNYNSSVPVSLIFSFHGHNETAASQEALSEFSVETLTYNPNGIAVYPEGLAIVDNEQGWQGDPRNNATNDVGFVHDMINHFTASYCIDTRAIYASGKSNGGAMVNVLACDPLLSTLIAAYAPVSGAFYQGLPGYPHTTESQCTVASRSTIPIPCSPSRANIPMLEFHGLEDTTIPYLGGYRLSSCLPTIPHWVRAWSQRQGYGVTNTTTRYAGYARYQYGNTSESLGVVTHYALDDTAHFWPSTSGNADNLGNVSAMDATPVIMEFFAKWKLPEEKREGGYVGGWKAGPDEGGKAGHPHWQHGGLD